MTSALAERNALVGVQQPRISSVPPYASSSGQEAVELAAMSGMDLDPWQQLVLRESLGESAIWKCSRCTYRTVERVRCPTHPRAELVHPWAAFEVGLVMPRQNGKSELLVARMLAGVFLLGESLVIFSAHQFDTAMEIFHRLVAVIENTPELVRKVRLNRGKVGTYSHGSEGITLKRGQRIRFKARTSGGGRGFSCDCLLLDEAMFLPESFLGATIPTLSARPNPQMWSVGSAVDQQVHEHGIVLAKRRERGHRGGDGKLAYFEWSAEGEDPDAIEPSVLADPQVWAQANPGLGIRISTDYLEGEAVAMGSRNFAVERLGVGDWPATEGTKGVIDLDDWNEREDLDSETKGPLCFAVDVTPDRSWAAIAVAGFRPDGRRHIEVVEHDRGTDWVVDRFEQLIARHKASAIVCDGKGPVASLMPDLANLRTRLVPVTAQEHAQACGMLYDAVQQGTVRHLGTPELSVAVSGAVKRPLGDAWAWSRRSSAIDISPLVACTLALWGLQTITGKPRRSRVIDLNAALAQGE